MFKKIFAYCERGMDPSFWAEPVNAATNVAFLIAALMAWVLWRSERGLYAGVTELLLVLLVAVIGTGSFLFHTYAEPWAALADTVPIGIFMVSYLAYALRRYLNWGWIAIFLALVVFFFSLAGSSMVRCNGGPCLNGSVAYFPAFAVLVVIGGYLLATGHRAGGHLIAAGLLFAVSLTFRSIDRLICQDTAGIVTPEPIGTHFMWHVLNALLLYLLLRAAILYGAGVDVRRQRAVAA
jgi:hypothetical protein